MTAGTSPDMLLSTSHSRKALPRHNIQAGSSARHATQNLNQNLRRLQLCSSRIGVCVCVGGGNGGLRLQRLPQRRLKLLPLCAASSLSAR